MHRGRDHNNRGFQRGRASIPYGPRHSSPHALQNSPGSPNIPPIPTVKPVPSPQVRLFAPALPTGVAVAWGSGAIPLGMQPISTVPVQLPSQTTETKGSQGQTSDCKKDRFHWQAPAVSQTVPEKPSQFDNHHDARQDDNRNHDQDNERGHQGSGNQRGQERGGFRGNRRGRGGTFHRGEGDRGRGYDRGGVELKDDRMRGDSHPRHGEHGAILREDRATPELSDYYEKDSGNRDRTRRDATDDYSHRTKHSRWEDDRDARHRGAVLRDDREHRPILREDREDSVSVSSSHHGARLIEDIDDGGDRGYRQSHSSGRSDRGREAYTDHRDERRDSERNRGRDRYHDRDDRRRNSREFRDPERADIDRNSSRDLREHERSDRVRNSSRIDIDRERSDGDRNSRREFRDHERSDRGRIGSKDYGEEDRIDRSRHRSRDSRDAYSDSAGHRDNSREMRDSVRSHSREFRDSYSNRGDTSDRNRTRSGDRGEHYRERNNSRDNRDTDRSGTRERGGERRESRERFRDSGRHGSVHSDREDRDRRGHRVEEFGGGDRRRDASVHASRSDRGRDGSVHASRSDRGRDDASAYMSRSNSRTARDDGPWDRDLGHNEERRAECLERGRTGAVLIEDRKNERPVLRDDRDLKPDVGRTGAILIEDRSKDLGPTHSSHTHRGHAHSSHTHHGHAHHDHAHRGQGRRSADRPSERGRRGRPHQRSEERSHQRSEERSQSQKRSWCSGVDEWREDTALSDRGSLCEETYSEVDCWPESGADVWSDRGSVVDMKEEPQRKRRRIREPSEEKEVQCIRSGSPPTQGENEEDCLPAWVRSSPADLYFVKEQKTGNVVTTKRMQELEKRFETELVQRNARAKAAQAPYNPPKRPEPKWQHSHSCPGSHHDHDEVSSLSSSDSDSDSDSDQEEWWIEELKRKEHHPYRLNKELWHNEKGELNYGPLCRCSLKSQKTGIRHDKYPGEQPVPLCDVNSNNLDKLYHYKITVSPVTNFLTKRPTIIMFDGHEYMFEGFSIFTHKKIPRLPECQVIRFYIVYTIHIIEEPPPENFSVRSLDLFTKYLFDEILELFDIDWKGPGGDNDCQLFHVMPRFARPFPENGKEIMSMNDVLLYLLKSAKPLVSPKELPDLLRLDQDDWQKFVDSFRYMVVTCPGKKPSSIRIDQLDKQNCDTKDGPKYPLIVHHGLRPAQLSYAGDPVYKKKWREYMKFRHLLWSRTKVSTKDKEKLEEFEMDLQQIRLKCTMKREITVDIDSEGFLLTGIRADICQHAMLLPILFGHIRFHDCLQVLEKTIGYEFKDKSLLQLAFTHSSYKINHGTNPDHGRNSLSNCGSRQLEFGDHKIHIRHTRKRGLNILLRIMSKMAKKSEERSEIPHNERLEFLGDAVVEFITSTHLFYMFPYADEGELTAYRGSLVQNAQLAVLANKLKLQDYLLYAHGPDLCHTRDLRHAMANCFEALMGALFLDGGIELTDRVFSHALFDGEPDLLETWINVPKHPLQDDEPDGDRHWIKNSPTLQKLLEFENDVGYEFRHVRLLAKSFTQRNIGYNHLTLGHNQRLEFLGDTIMKLIASDYLFRHFPDHHEGHLTLLRSSLVNNKTQSTVAEEIGMTDYVINMQKEQQSDTTLKQKEKADLLEAFLGAMYVDGGLEPCYVLCNVCFFPRLEDFILNQEWNDPKSQLQQCCLTLREMNDESPDIPVYKVLSKSGPTNSRIYKVGVYFRNKRLAVGSGGSKQMGEMRAAENALKETKGLFHNRFWTLELDKSAAIQQRDLKKAREQSKREQTPKLGQGDAATAKTS